MNPEQFSQLLAALEKVASGLAASKSYTITGAADWPILVVVGGLLMGAIGAMWTDLRSLFREGKAEWKETVKEIRADNERDHDLLWAAMRDCQSDCCPRVREHIRPRKEHHDEG